MAYTSFLGFQNGFGDWLSGLFPDVFDPAWNQSIFSIAEKICVPLRNDPYLIGYFSDNEVFCSLLPMQSLPLSPYLSCCRFPK